MLAWAIISLMQASIIILYFKMDTILAVADSLVFNTIYFFFGLIVWYPVRFIPLSNRNINYVIMNHLVLGILVISAWMSSGFYILKALFSEDEIILQFLIRSVPYRIVSGIFLFISLLLIYYLIVYSRNLKEKILNEANLHALVRESELNMLKSQINPHFLFNSLNSASSLTIRDPGKAREMIVKLSEYLRYSLRNTGRVSNPFKEEVDNIRRYLEIEKVRFGQRLNFNIDYSENDDHWPLPNMILQPLIENAVKHGVYESSDAINIEMICAVENDLMKIRIRNNYDRDGGRSKGTGLGLSNIKERLRLIYGRDDLLNIKKTEDLFEVALLIPLEQMVTDNVKEGNENFNIN